MKPIITILTSLIVTTFAIAQNFERLYPTEQLATVTSINIHSSGIGYASQECGYALKTIDGGESWEPFNLNIENDTYFSEFVFLDDADPDKILYRGQRDLLYSDDGFQTFQDIKPASNIGLMSEFVQISEDIWGVAGGFYMFTTDRGQTWTNTTNIDVSGSAIYAKDGAVYVAYKNIWRSIDNGITFTSIYESEKPIRKFLEVGNRLMGATSDSFIESLDGGLTWTDVVSVEFYGYADNLQVKGTRLIANSSNRINYSDDFGRTWTSIVMPIGVSRTSCMHIDDSGTIFVGGEGNQIYKTPDVNTPLDKLQGFKNHLYDIAVDGDRVYAVGERFLIYSDNYGEHFNKRTLGELSLDRIVSAGDNMLIADGTGGIHLLSQDFSTELNLSTDNWISSLLYSQSTDIVYCASDNNVYSSLDQGENWSLSSTFDEQIQVLKADEQGYLYAAVDNSIWISTDNGSQWSIVANMGDIGYINDILAFSDQEYIVLAAKIYHTTDGGASFTEKQRPYNGLKLYKGNEDDVYCLGANGANGWLYKSSDQGINFSDLSYTCGALSRSAFFDKNKSTFWGVGSGLDIEKVLDITISDISSVPTTFSQLDISPNPAYRNIYLQENEDIYNRIEIIDVQGRIQQFSTYSTQINIESLSDGYYILRAIGDNTVGQVKFIKMSGHK